MVIARGTWSSALKWLDTHGLSLPLLLDPNLELYKQLGLKRSVKGVWSVGTLLSYAEDRISGVPSSPSYEGDDIHVMGGDFIADSTGKLVYAYQSQHSSDRPTTQQIFNTLDASS